MIRKLRWKITGVTMLVAALADTVPTSTALPVPSVCALLPLEY